MSLSAISIGIILILTLLNIIKKQFKIIIIQLIIISAYVFIYIYLSINIDSLNLKHGLFLVLGAITGLITLYTKIENKNTHNIH